MSRWDGLSPSFFIGRALAGQDFSRPHPLSGESAFLRPLRIDIGRRLAHIASFGMERYAD